MSKEAKHFKLWAQLNKENIFSQKDSFSCLKCEYARKYQENTELYKQLIKSYQLIFTKCTNLKTEYWKVSYSYCPFSKNK